MYIKCVRVFDVRRRNGRQKRKKKNERWDGVGRNVISEIPRGVLDTSVVRINNGDDKVRKNDFFFRVNCVTGWQKSSTSKNLAEILSRGKAEKILVLRRRRLVGTANQCKPLPARLRSQCAISAQRGLRVAEVVFRSTAFECFFNKHVAPNNSVVLKISIFLFFSYFFSGYEIFFSPRSISAMCGL